MSSRSEGAEVPERTAWHGARGGVTLRTLSTRSEYALSLQADRRPQ